MNKLTLIIRIVQVLVIAGAVVLMISPVQTLQYVVGLLALAVLGEIVARFNHKPVLTNGVKRDFMYKFFFYGISVLIVVLLFVGAWGAYMLSNSTIQAIALAVIILWACVFLGYFVWAVYFYNINLGITEDEWDRINAAKEKKRTGQYYSEADINEEPKYNPYDDQTFGLPPGTVRGMIAFTLLFGAISMLIFSIGMKDCVDCQVYRDQFEFFKTAFLMMIAFYFGSKSLEYLSPKKDNNARESKDGAPDAGTKPSVPGFPKAPDATGGGTAATKAATGLAASTEEATIEFIDPMMKK